MNTVNEINSLLRKKINEAFRSYPVLIQESPEDEETLWVQVFAVPTDRVREVKDFIHDLQDAISDDGGVVLLPMIKNLEVTRKHYPQFSPCEIPENITAYGRYQEPKKKGYTLVGGVFQSTLENKWDGEFSIEYHPQQMPWKPTEPLQPANLVGNAADTQLALAA